MKINQSNFKQWRNDGEHWVWLNAAAVATCMIMVFGLVALIAFRGLVHFWPSNVELLTYQQEGQVQYYAGEPIKSEISINSNTGQEQSQTLYKIGNREHYGLDFKWLIDDQVSDRILNPQLVVIEREEWGNVYATVTGFTVKGTSYDSTDQATLFESVEQAIQLKARIKQVERSDIGAINLSMEKLRREVKRLQSESKWDSTSQQNIATEQSTLDQQYEELNTALNQQRESLEHIGEIQLKTADGIEYSVPFSEVVRLFYPNQMSVLEKTTHYFAKLWEFIADDPREANTEGGIFPAIFGTVIMVLLMTVFVTPFGVIAAVYLREYAKQGLMVRLIRISVNNLAGVPSIVYGVFGLGFFVYAIGGSIDDLFYSYALPSPTFGSPGLLWASLTLALLTLPVVIVSTEEGLSRVPSAIREGSLALGATKFETLMRTVIPMTSPAIMTGLILAVARAAGEVAPLMLVGVVKLAPDLAIDSVAPYLHLDRQFMHLGFHIYDVGFQSPNVEAARPLVYSTALLLVVIIVVLNLTAIKIRNNLREKYKSLE